MFKDSRPFDGTQGRERVERVPGVKGSSEKPQKRISKKIGVS